MDWLTTEDNSRIEDDMKETIEWHKYPDEKPKESNHMHLTQWEEGVIVFQWWLGDDWDYPEEKVFAWAEMPKGIQDE